MLRRLGILSAGVLLLQLAGCASHEFAPTRADACKPTGNDKDCALEVVVREDTAKGECSVAVNLQEIEFPRGVQDKFIYWKLVGPAGYVFPDNGIAIDRNFPPDFDKPKVMDGGRTFRWRNRHKQPDPKVYYYGIVVENTDASITCFQDPRINNR
jgi:hypothetical protein